MQLLRALDCAIDRGAGHAEELGDLASRVGAGAVQLHEVLLLRGREFGLATAKLAGGLRDRHALAGTGADEVGLELGDHAENGEQQPADGVGRVLDRSPEVQGDARLRQLVRDVRRVTERAGEAVELGDDQDVAGTAHSQRLAKARPGSNRSRKSVVNMHVLIANTERPKTIALCCEILPGGRDTGMPDEHPTTVAIRPPSPGIFAGQAYANPQARRHLAWNDETGFVQVSR